MHAEAQALLNCMQWIICVASRSLAPHACALQLAEVVHACLAHALTTEGEEIMGLLLGSITPVLEEGASANSGVSELQGVEEHRSGNVAGSSHEAAAAAPMAVARVWMAYPQIRTDRRKDRVECSPEQV